MANRICSIEGCGKSYVAKGFCAMHYRRNNLFGDPHYHAPRAKDRPCAIPECDTPAHSLGWCQKHYWRWYAYGDPLYQPRRNRWDELVRPVEALGCLGLELEHGLCLFDTADAELLSEHIWRSWTPNGLTFYAVTGGGTTGVSMHRLLLKAPTGMSCDHENGNGLDNRRVNLRLATGSQNGSNRAGWGQSSRFKGVSWIKSRRQWQAAIKVNRKRIPLGRFPDEEVAARAYDAAAKRYFGEFAWLNFPDDQGSTAGR